MITNLPIRGVRLRGNDMFDEIATVDCDTESYRWVKTRIFGHAAGVKNVLLDCDVEVVAPPNPLIEDCGARELFDGWHSNFLNMGHSRDQPWFLKALVGAPATRFFALPPIWNAAPSRPSNRREMKRNRKPFASRITDPIFLASRRAATSGRTRHRGDRIGPSLYRLRRAAGGLLVHRSALFPLAAGWTLFTRLMFPTGRIKPQRRGVGKRERPVASG
jgi:hypothetical protein